MPTITICPQCYGAKKVHQSVYDRTKIPSNQMLREDTWRASRTKSDGSFVVAAESAPCRTCDGRGTI